MGFKFSSIILCAAFIAPAAQAQWTGKAELGYLQSSGNAESTSANTKFDLKRESEKWINTFYVGALYGNNGEFTNAERYEARYQLDYKINDRLSWFSALRGEKDKFSGFVYQATVSTGAAYKFIDTPDDQAGVLARRRLSAIAERSADQDRCRRSHRPHRRRGGERSGRHAGIRRMNTTSPRTPRSPTSSWRSPDRTNTALQDDLALQVSMTKTLALAVGYGIRYNTDPPPLSETTDTLITVNLVYNIQ